MSRRPLRLPQLQAGGKIISLELNSIFCFSFKVHFSVYYSFLIILCLTLVGQDFKVANHVFFSFKFASGLTEFEDHFLFFLTGESSRCTFQQIQNSFPLLSTSALCNPALQHRERQPSTHNLHISTRLNTVLPGFCKNVPTIILLSIKSICKPRDIVCKYSLRKKKNKSNNTRQLLAMGYCHHQHLHSQSFTCHLIVLQLVLIYLPFNRISRSWGQESCNTSFASFLVSKEVLSITWISNKQLLSHGELN